MSCCTQGFLGSAQSVLDVFSLKLFGDQKKTNQKDIHISATVAVKLLCNSCIRQPSVTGTMNYRFHKTQKVFVFYVLDL